MLDLFSHPEIPWPCDPSTLPRDEHGQAIVGEFIVFRTLMGWSYGRPNGEDRFAIFDTERMAVNDGALRDDYRG